MSQPGKSFDQKFISMVLYCKREEPALNKRLKETKKEVGRWKNTLEDLRKKAIDVQQSIYALESVKNSHFRLISFIDSVLASVNDHEQKTQT
jgi:predicted  nucleic acid-binding Zn-ribbon protein